VTAAPSGVECVPSAVVRVATGSTKRPMAMPAAVKREAQRLDEPPERWCSEMSDGELIRARRTCWDVGGERRELRSDLQGRPACDPIRLLVAGARSLREVVARRHGRRRHPPWRAMVQGPSRERSGSTLSPGSALAAWRISPSARSPEDVDACTPVGWRDSP